MGLLNGVSIIMNNIAELKEKDLKSLLQVNVEGGARTINSISAVFDSVANDWKLIIEVYEEQFVTFYSLIEKRGQIKGFKSLDKMVDRLRKMGAKEIVIKLDL